MEVNIGKTESSTVNMFIFMIALVVISGVLGKWNYFCKLVTSVTIWK